MEIITKNNKKYLRVEVVKEFDLSKDLDLRGTDITSLPISVLAEVYIFKALVLLLCPIIFLLAEI